jgi:hypothetical protein
VATLRSIKAGSGRDPAKTEVRRRKKFGVRTSGAGSRSSDGQIQAGSGRAVRIPAPLRAFLGLERDEIIKVQSLLVCMGKAIEVEHPAKGPYYPDIVGLAADILRRRVVNFDELLLDGLLPVGFDQGSSDD